MRTAYLLESQWHTLLPRLNNLMRTAYLLDYQWHTLVPPLNCGAYAALALVLAHM